MDGWKSLIVCNSAPPYDGPCNFNMFIELIKNGIHDMVLVSTLVVVAMLCYVGFELLTSQGNTSTWTSAKDRLMKVVWGYVWILAAWLIVYTIANTLIDSKYLPTDFK